MEEIKLYIGKTERGEVSICGNPRAFIMAYQIKKEIADLLLGSEKRETNKEKMESKLKELEEADIIPYYSGIFNK